MQLHGDTCTMADSHEEKTGRNSNPRHAAPGTRHNRDLTGVAAADIVFQLLSYVAETERAFIRRRQAEGTAATLVRCVRFGRRPNERPEDFEILKTAWENGEI